MNSVEFISSLEKIFELSFDDREFIYNDLIYCFNESYKVSRVSMIPSSFQIPKEIPTEGDLILCFDIGGSTIRISVIEIKCSSVAVKLQKQWLLKEDEKLIDLKFFDDLIKKSIELISQFDKKSWNVGISWSFPLTERNKIITMGKGFIISDEIKSSPINELISDSFNKSKIIIDKVSIINDSISVALSTLLDKSENSNISLIVGTGINSCINFNNQLINVELGFFGKLPRPTKYDLIIDSRWNQDLKPHLIQDDSNLFQPLEFLCSSRYIIKLFKIIAADLIDLGIIRYNEFFFDDLFEIHGSFILLFENLKDIESIIPELIKQNFNFSIDDIKTFNRVLNIIIKRSSIFASLSIKALNQFINNSDDNVINVNYIGSFLENSTLYQNQIIKQSNNSIRLHHIRNSSIIGAGIASYISI